MLKRNSILVFFVCILVASEMNAKLSVPSIIRSDMVLQQQTRVKLWGETDPGREVILITSWSKQALVKANEKGAWLAEIKTPKAGGPHWVQVTNGEDTLKWSNVMIGEVWFCSGQSNMEFPVGLTSKYWHTGVPDHETQIAQADYPNIRFFTVGKKTSRKPLNSLDGEWRRCTPLTVNDFSAVAYFFGKKIHETLQVPVGLIHASWGGTPAESWTRHEYLENDTMFRSILLREEEVLQSNDEQKMEEYRVKLAEWEKAVANGSLQGKAAKRGPSEPMNPLHSKMPSVLYNGMVAPVIPFTIKGVIWYQGESNNDHPQQYSRLFPAMIRNWRDDWNQGDFPFIFVQIASHYRMTPQLREAQFQTLLTVKNTGMAVTLDVGDSTDIHPRQKQPVGERLALWPLAGTYRAVKKECSGPLFRGVKIKGDRIIVSFTHSGEGLEAKNNALNWFEIAGADKMFVSAHAEISGRTVVVSSPKVKKPLYVRYAWQNFVRPDLFSKDGLPASSFRNYQD